MSQALYGVIQAENFISKSNFKIVSASYADGGKIVQQSGGGTASIETAFKGRPGTYDLKVTYFDENDGESQSSIFVDGKKLDSWTWDAQLGSKNAGSATLTSHTIRNVTIDDDAKIRIEGRANGGEPLRIDKIDLLPASNRNAGNEDLASFEGATGFGTTASGGRGGWIVKVTNLNDSGIGSLRWALEDIDVPRIVVFDVGGLIRLKDQIWVNGDVTIAGQTAPGDGITLKGAPLKITESNVIVRGLHIRPGGDKYGAEPEYRDALSIGDSQQIVENIVIDGNTFSWAIDEGVTVWYKSRDVTISNNIISEVLHESRHPSGAHSEGMLLGSDSTKITIKGNLFANNFYRNPQVDDARQVEFINNLVYNYGNEGFAGLAGGSRSTTAHVIGNHFIAGDDTSTAPPVRFLGKSTGTEYYLEDNIGPYRTSSDQPERDIAGGDGKVRVKDNKIFAGSGVDPISAFEVKDHVLEHAGAFAWDRGKTDTRLINDILAGRSGVIDHQNQVGGYQVTATDNALSDADDDGIPDIHERTIGSDPDRFDPHGDVDRDGYTNIEEYLNGLVDGTIKQTTTPVLKDIILEAENFAFKTGLKEVSNPHASAGSFVQASGSGAHILRTVFDGKSGEYDLVLGYFDETDGRSSVSISVNGSVVDNWTWNKSLGSKLADNKTKTTHKIADIDLDPGDVIEINGSPDGMEPLRIDYLLFDG